MVTVFCSRLGWGNLELLLSQFQERLQFGVQRELVDLVRLPLLNGQRARVLYDAGVKTIADLAQTEPAQIEQILHKSGPFSRYTLQISYFIDLCIKYAHAHHPNPNPNVFLILPNKLFCFHFSEVHGSQSKNSIWVWVEGKKGITENEAAGLIVNEARQFLQVRFDPHNHTRPFISKPYIRGN